MTRSERLEAALVALVHERRGEIDAIQAMHAVEIHLTFDLAGCIDFETVRYEVKRQKRRMPRRDVA